MSRRFSPVAQASRLCSPKERIQINTKNTLAPAPLSRYIGRMPIKDQTRLIRDLLDPDLDTPEIARRHKAEPADLRAAVRSPAFQTAAAAMREVDEARTAALLPVHRSRALQRLARIVAQPAETTAQTESARRAATALIRAGRSALRADSADWSESGANSGCRTDGAASCTPRTERSAPASLPPPPIADRQASDPRFADTSPKAARPRTQTPTASRPATPQSALTIGDLLTILAPNDPPISRNQSRAAHPAKPTTAAELLARVNTG